MAEGNTVPVLTPYQGLCFYGRVTEVVSATQFRIAGLAGKGDNFFRNYRAVVIRDAGGVGGAPQGEQRRVTDYTSATGTITLERAFSALLEEGDEITFLHPGLSPVTPTPTVLYQARPDGVGSFRSEWLDFRNYRRAVIVCTSTLDQPVLLQLVGNGVPDFNTAMAVGSPQALNIGGPPPIAPASLSLGIDDDWHPYLALVATTTIAPASGELVITVYTQE